MNLKETCEDINTLVGKSDFTKEDFKKAEDTLNLSLRISKESTEALEQSIKKVESKKYKILNIIRYCCIGSWLLFVLANIANIFYAYKFGTSVIPSDKSVIFVVAYGIAAYFIYICLSNIVSTETKNAMSYNKDMTESNLITFVNYLKYAYIGASLDLNMYKELYSHFYNIQEWLKTNSKSGYNAFMKAIDELGIDFSKYKAEKEGLSTKVDEEFSGE